MSEQKVPSMLDTVDAIYRGESELAGRGLPILSSYTEQVVRALADRIEEGPEGIPAAARFMNYARDLRLLK